MLTLLVFMFSFLNHGTQTINDMVNFGPIDYIFTDCWMHVDELAYFFYDTFPFSIGRFDSRDVAEFFIDYLEFPAVYVDLVLIGLCLIIFTVITIVAIKKEIKARKDGK